jgi:hypothetical protein
LDKFLKGVIDARNLELGKLAAYEFEQLNNDISDYTSSVKRFYQRNSIISPLRPMSILHQIGFDDSSLEDPRTLKSL